MIDLRRAIAIDSGAEANGSWAIFSNGTLICWRKFSEDPRAWTAGATAGFWRLHNGGAITLPKAFSDYTEVVITGTNQDGAISANVAFLSHCVMVGPDTYEYYEGAIANGSTDGVGHSVTAIGSIR